MFGIIELDVKILTYLDIETLKNVCFLNKNLNNIIFNNEQFWKNKFEYDQIIKLDGQPSFQEYIKISDCKDKAEKILTNSKMNYTGKLEDEIIIRLKNNWLLLIKILPHLDENLYSVAKNIKAVYQNVSIVVAPIINEKVMICFSNRGVPSFYVYSYKLNSDQEKLRILTKGLYYDCEINKK